MQDDDTKRSKKKPKTRSEKTHQRVTMRGHLAFLTEMPIDVLLEVFSHLEPVDLLHLSRASNSLHNLLNSSNSAFLWKSAYNDLPWETSPPLFPEGVNVIQYTNFLYGRHCQYCTSRRGLLCHATAFIRFCENCVKDNFLQLNAVDPAEYYLLNSWPFQHNGRSTSLVCRKEHNLIQLGLSEAKKENNVDKYTMQHRQAVALRRNLASQVESWRLQFEKWQKRALLSKRESDIRKKIQDEGYGEDLRKCGRRLRRFRHVRKARELTDAEWLDIRADFLDSFQDKRDEQRMSDIQSQLSNGVDALGSFIAKYWDKLPVCPTALQVASHEPFLSLLQSSLSKKLSTPDFQKLESQLFDVVALWRQEADLYLVSLVPHLSSRKGKKRQTTQPLKLATTFFKCYWCTEPISYPRILVHQCFSNISADEVAVGEPDQEDAPAEGEEAEENNEDQDEEDQKPVTVRRRGRREPREPRPPKEITCSVVWPSLSEHHPAGMHAGRVGVSFDMEAYNAARDIIFACGEDPDTVTSTKMEEKDARVECLRCSRAMQSKGWGGETRLFMNWTLALLHDLKVHYDEAPLEELVWKMIDSEGDDMQKIKEAELKTMKRRKLGPYRCTRCGSCQHSTHGQLERHLTSQHGIHVDKSEILQLFLKDPDSSILKGSCEVKL